MTTSRDEVAQAIPGAGPLVHVDKVIARQQATIDDSVAGWASSFAPVNEEYIAYVTRSAKPQTKEELLRRWGRVPVSSESYARLFGQYSVSVEKHRGGWVVDRLSQVDDPDYRVLSTSVGELPALFPTFSNAVAVVEAYFPDPPPGFIWSAGED